MHIELGVVTGAKIVLSYVTVAGAFGIAAKMAYNSVRDNGGVVPLLLRCVITTGLVFGFFKFSRTALSAFPKFT